MQNLKQLVNWNPYNKKTCYAFIRGPKATKTTELYIKIEPA